MARPPPAPPRTTILLAIFVASGAFGVVYEVAWTRLLTRVLGNTIPAVSTVIALFLGGLALGAWLGGRMADRRRARLAWYAALEAATGLYAFLVPFLASAAEPVYGALYRRYEASPAMLALARALVSGVILVPPCVLMGATLPVLAVVAVRDPKRIGHSIGRLYTANTLGAAAGAILAGFVLLRFFGTRGAIWAAAAGNLALALLTWRLDAGDPEGWRAPDPASAENESAAAPAASKTGKKKKAASKPAAAKEIAPAPAALLLLASTASGFTTLLYEVAWTRTLGMVLGSSTYAFSILLAGCILGLGAGSAIVTRRMDRIRDPLVVLAATSAGAGVLVFLIQFVFDDLPLLMVQMVLSYKDSIGTLLTLEFGLVLLLLFLPTTLLGAIFPLLCHAYARRLSDLGGSVGRLYLSNTLGSIAGSALTGFLIIPAIGIQRTLFVGVLSNLWLAAIALAYAPGVQRHLRIGAVAVAALAVPGIFRVGAPWSREVLSSGTYLYADRFKGMTDAAAINTMKQAAILYYREGMHATVSVTRGAGTLAVTVDGKTDATNAGDMDTQVLLGLLPALVHGAPRDALVIGLASGVTAGALLRVPTIARLDAAEIEPAMVPAARIFSAWNGDVLSDPRLNLRVTDGRNLLVLGRESYDVIVSEPSNPWMAGVAALFTRESFQAARARLKPGGVMCQWLHTYRLSADSVRLIVRTFLDVFPRATLWYVGTSSTDVLLVARVPGPGEAEDVFVDPARIEALLGEPGVSEVTGRIMTRSLDTLFGDFVMGPDELRELGGKGPIHRDDRMSLEFDAPLELFDARGEAKMTETFADGRVSAARLLRPGTDPSFVKRAEAAYRARAFTWRADVAAGGGRLQNAHSVLQDGLREAPVDRGVYWYVANWVLGLVSDRDPKEQTLGALSQAIALCPECPMPYRKLAVLHTQGKDRDDEKAVAAFEEYLRRRPLDAEVLDILTDYFTRRGDTARADEYRARAARAIGKP